MNPGAVKRVQLLASALSLLALVLVAAGVWFFTRLQASRPQLDGRTAVPGLVAPVTITRDALGVPNLQGESREDLARALGWLHAQERFFQMDLLRRRAAGELAELFGKSALPLDRAVRRHGFRRVARQALTLLQPDERRLLDAYAAGVNAGLDALGASPFEHLVLRTEPETWLVEDSLLVAHAMTLELQDEDGRYERTLMTLRDYFGPEALPFFAPLQTPADAALDGSAQPLAPIPGPELIDLRRHRTAASEPGPSGGPRAAATEADLSRPPFRWSEADSLAPGSNAVALAGNHTASGAALLANDMHLGHRMPNIWYRASLTWLGESKEARRRVTGVTLPGVPLVVAGSNGRVAWGFTNAHADTGDLVVVQKVPGLTRWYLTPGEPGSTEIEERREIIEVKGAKPITVDYPWTVWGPIIGTDGSGRDLALRWVAHEPAATNLGLAAMETAGDVKEAIDIAHRSGIPAQNILIADHRGDIGWTIAGFLPRRIGYDGRLPVSWRFGDRRWDGFLPPAQLPVFTTRPSGAPAERPLPTGRLWSANQRHVGGTGLAALGDGGYDRPYRAVQIRDRLAGLEQVTERDLLALQLDDRALFLEPWHRLLLETLAPETIASNRDREGLRAAALTWSGRAGVDDAAYRLTREFRQFVRRRVFSAIFARCTESYPAFDWESLSLEGATWQLLHARPSHLLNPAIPSWDALLLAAADAVVERRRQEGESPLDATWGRWNTVSFRHPLSLGFPSLARWLDAPPISLPGDSDMPRVQGRTFGVSERHVVAPGRESEGIFQMPGGQSGHPFSPFYTAGHLAWARGEPGPFLPGPPAHTLTLEPTTAARR